MKILSIIAVLLIVLAFIVNGCDSVTGDKPLQVTIPTLVYPPNNDSIGVSVTPTFRWIDSADKIEIATNLYLNDIIFSKAVTDSSYTLDSGILNHNTWYYWHLGKATAGTENWTTVWGFKTN